MLWSWSTQEKERSPHEATELALKGSPYNNRECWWNSFSHLTVSPRSSHHTVCLSSCSTCIVLYLADYTVSITRCQRMRFLVVDFPGVPSMNRRWLQRVYTALHANVHGYQTPGIHQGGLQQSGDPPVVDSCSVPLVVANNEAAAVGSQLLPGILGTPSVTSVLRSSHRGFSSDTCTPVFYPLPLPSKSPSTIRTAPGATQCLYYHARHLLLLLCSVSWHCLSLLSRVVGRLSRDTGYIFPRQFLIVHER